MHGEPFGGILAKPERRSVVKRKAKAVRRLTRAQCRAIVFRRAHSRCERCHRDVTDDCAPWADRRAHVNERKPKSLGGSPYEPDNCELLCRGCHMPNGQHAPTKTRMDKLNALTAKAKQAKALARG